MMASHLTFYLFTIINANALRKNNTENIFVDFKRNACFPFGLKYACVSKSSPAPLKSEEKFPFPS